jgi:hypothetical protein
MYKPVETHTRFLSSHGLELTPIASLQEGQNGLCHIVLDDGCYAAYLFNEWTGFVPTEYIFAELHEALARLPTPC